MFRLKKAIFALLIFALLFPNLGQAFVLRPILTGLNDKILSTDLDLKTEDKLEIDLPDLKIDNLEKIEKIDVLSPQEIIENTKNNVQPYLASSWDQGFLLDNKKEDNNVLANNLTTDLFTGAAQYIYHFNLPAGRNGMSPQLSLLYNHQLQNYNDYMGLGWTLGGLLYIERDARNGVDSLYQDNKFIFSNGGSLLPYALTDLVHGEYHLEIDDGNALRFFYTLNNSWEIVDKNGIHYYLGENLTARDYSGNKTYRWNIEFLKDKSDNNIKYEYEYLEGVSYPKSITYTNWANEIGIYHIDFDYTDREKDYLVYNAGFAQNYNRQLFRIEIYVKNVLRRSYRLTVSDGDSPLLWTIFRENYDKNGIYDGEIYRSDFDYNQDQSIAWNREDWGPVDFSFLYPGDTQLVDINNDGFSDVLRSGQVLYNNGNSESVKETWLNNKGQGLVSASSDFLAALPFYNYYENGYSFFTDTKYIDINGDSNLDIVDSGDVYICENNSSGTNSYIQNANYDWWPHWYYLNNKAIEKSTLADLNGDSFVDYIFNQNRNSYLNKWANNANNIVANWTQSPLPIIDSNENSTGSRFIDLNNDGLDDLLQSFYDESTGTISKNAYLNKGDGSWDLAANDYYNPVLFFNQKNLNGDIVDKKVFLIDINNDGFKDFVNGRTGEVYLFNNKTWNKTANAAYQLREELHNGLFWEDFRWGQADGQPGLDLWYLESQAGQDHLIVYENKSAYKNLLTEVQNEYGAKINLEYTTTALEENNNGPITVLLKKVLVDDGFGQKQLEEYSYEGGEYYIDDIWQKGRNGFSKITRTAFDGHKEEYFFHQGNDNDNYLEAFDSPSHRGRVYLEKKLDLSGDLLEESYYNWQSVTSSNFHFMRLADESIHLYDNGQSKYKTTAYDYDSFGNLLEVIDYKETNVSFANREFSDIDRMDNIYINYEYARDRRGEIRNAASRVWINDYNGDILKDQKYYYDGLEYGAVSLGFVKKEEILKDINKWISTTNDYDKYGLLIRQSDFKGNNNYYKYDKFNLFPELIANDLNFTENYSYDYFCSEIIKETDLNGVSFLREFDNACRLKNLYRQNEKTGESQHLQNFTYENSFPSQVKEKRYLDKIGRYQELVSYFDGFKRKILQLNSLANLNWQANLYTYDQNGNLIFKSDYFEVYSEKYFPYSPSVSAEFKYDELNRLVEFKDSNYLATINYALLEKEIVVNAKARRFSFDIDGNLIEVGVKSGPVFNSSFYEYDILGRLNKHIDAAGNERNWQYDKLDNLIYNEDAHAVSDASFLTWEYIWDDNANLVQKKILPAGISLNYKYDKLNRLVSEDDSSTYYLDFSYLYDAGKNALGKLSGVKASNFEKTFIYDDFAYLSKENYLIKGNSYNYEYLYNYLGFPLSVTYPDKSILNYEYNINGQLYRSWLMNPDGFREGILESREYNLWGAVSQESYANGTFRNYEFNDRKNLIQERISDRNNNTLWQQNYEIDWDDNLESFEIDSAYFNDNYRYEFQHDDLNRLGRYDLYKNTILDDSNNYDYDLVNNLIADNNYDFYYEVNNAAFNNPYASKTAIAKNSAHSNMNFNYDKQGNVLSESTNIYEWNAYNRLLSRNSSDGRINYFYDEDGQRLFKEDKNISEIFAGAYREKSDGEVNIHYNEFQKKINSKGEINKTFNYYDKFENLILQLDEKSLLLNYFIYKPFGEIYLAANGNRGSPYLFHNQEREGDLDYVNGRYYDYGAMRWLSLDPAYENLVVLDSNDLNHLLANPYLMNPYAYLGNSPWRYQDQNGEILETVIDLLSLGFSYYDFVMDPSVSSGLFFLYDLAATLIPFMPAGQTGAIASKLVSKAMKGGARMANQLRKLSSSIGKSLETTMKLVKTVSSQLATKSWATKLAKWSPGAVGNRLLNFAIHFTKHINDLVKFDIKNIDDYFNFSVSFLDNLAKDKVFTDLGIFYKIVDKGKEVFYNPFKKLMVVIGKNAEGSFVSSFYEIGSGVKHSKFWNTIKDLFGLFWQKLLSSFSFNF